MIIGDPENNLAALALLRAALTDDADAGVLILTQHQLNVANPVSMGFVLGLAAVAGRALMSGYAYNTETVLKIIDTWADDYAGQMAAGKP